ncbi:hypothetical protein ANCDUO_21276, partial [Ancylostoma duodenale]
RLLMTKFFYYFAYGSNLLKERIKVQSKRDENHKYKVSRVLTLLNQRNKVRTVYYKRHEYIKEDESKKKE